MFQNVGIKLQKVSNNHVKVSSIFILLTTIKFIDVIEHSKAHFQKSVSFGSLFWNTSLSNLLPTIGKRHSHSACTYDNSMYVFGGCTAACTTFNDLWKLDLDTRKWIRPITMGSYPSPKACATMLYYKKSFILFGGWSHPSPYPVYQVNIY